MNRPHLTTTELRILHDATVYRYQAGEYPADMPPHLLAYTIPDGGLLNALEQAIEMSQQLDQS